MTHDETIKMQQDQDCEALMIELNERQAERYQDRFYALRWH